MTVQASSPALIEKTREVVTDGTGQYKIVALPAGVYSVTFKLEGFNAFQRDGVELTGSATAPVNADLKVGAIEETVTVSGESPIVDVQSTTQQRVLSKDVIDTIPTGRMANSLAVLIPGVTSDIKEVGGSNFGALAPQLSIHGGRPGDGRFLINGMSPASAEGNGQYSGSLPNMTAAREITVNTQSSAETSSGGIVINLVPRDGGNQFSGTWFSAFSWKALQSDNFTPELQAAGLVTPNSLIDTFDVNPGFGGPIKRDRLWFYTAFRWDGSRGYVGQIQGNKNAGNPNAWTYVADPNVRAESGSYFHAFTGRITWQATPKHKIAFYGEDQTRCACPNGSSTTSPEAAVPDYGFPMNRFVTATWTAPLTNRLLFEAGAANKGESWHAAYPNDFDQSLIRVTEQSTGISYRGGPGTYRRYFQALNNIRASLNYVTGTHDLKIGFTDAWASKDDLTTPSTTGLAYRFNSGTPNQLTETATPYLVLSRIKYDLGIYAQDKWTIKQLTLNIGARFDALNTYFPAEHLGPAPFVPTRNLDFAESPFVNWRDITPRLGAAYDLFGDGKTALKASVNRYVLGTALQGVFGDDASPVRRLALTVTRTWNDNGAGGGIANDFVPQCDLTNPLQNGECAAASNTSFGFPIPSTNYDPATYKGWGTRPYSWEFSAGVQREVLPRVSLDVAYFRRIYGNFVVTDNLAVSASDFTQFSIPAPVDSRLPGGGGYAIGGLYDVNGTPGACAGVPGGGGPNGCFGLTNNYVTRAENFGTQTEHWNGLDVNVSARLNRGVLVQGGTSTGRTTANACEVHAQLPEQGNSPTAVFAGVNTNTYGTFCNPNSGWLTQVKLLAAYTVPKVDVQVSGAFQSLPGPEISASYAAPNSVALPSLGRDLSGGGVPASRTTTVPLLASGQVYGDRLNQLDLKVGKILRYGRNRATISLDVFNVTNANPVLTVNTTFGPLWTTPQSILNARYARISTQIDF